MAAFVVEDTTGDLRNYTTPWDAYSLAGVKPGRGMFLTLPPTVRWPSWLLARRNVAGWMW